MAEMARNRSQVVTMVLLAAALLAAVWVILQLVRFHEDNEQTVVYTDTPGLLADAREYRCVGRRPVEFDVRDYSYNVMETRPTVPMYRYKANNDAEPPVHIHLLAMQGGSGRVVLKKTGKPVWLVLLSSQPGIWHIEQSPGAELQRIYANQGVSEIRFAQSFTDQPSSLIDYLLRDDSQPDEMPEIVVLPNSPCLKQFSRFQKFDDQREFAATLAQLRGWLGHPEMSFQSAESPSYFEAPFRVPFTEPEIALDKLAAVKKLGEAPAPPPGRRKATDASRQALTDSLQKYADMPRRDDVRAVTFSSTAELLKTLGDYRSKRLLPSAMPKSQPGSRGAGVTSWYQLADYQNAYTQRVPAGKATNACGRNTNSKLLVVEGTRETNIVKCARGNQLYFMKDGDDHVDDSWEDDIIYGGPGDDILDAGWGNDLLFFNYGWGQDTVEKTCHDSAYVPQDSVRSTSVDWSREWPYKNFIVFGKDVKREDIVAVDNKLVHKDTGDSIRIKGDCFNVVYWQ